MEEIVDVDTNIPIRQGDIFVWPWEKDPWKIAGLIITADCDIAQDKSHGFFTYVPIVPLTYYISHIWANNRLRKLEKAHFAEMSTFLHKRHLEINPRAVLLSSLQIKTWVRTSSAEEILDQFGNIEEKELTKFEANHYRIAHLIMDGLDPNSKLSPFEVICQIRKLRNGGTAEQIAAQAQDELSSDAPLDVAFLCNLVSFGFPSGGAVMLRFVKSINPSELTTSVSEVRENRERALRVARLEPHVRYAITQKFANLFSRIGLPSDYESQQRETLRVACASFANI